MNKISVSFAQYPKYSSCERPSISDSEAAGEKRIAEIRDELCRLRDELQDLYVRVHGYSYVVDQDRDYPPELLEQKIRITSCINALKNELNELVGSEQKPESKRPR